MDRRSFFAGWAGLGTTAWLARAEAVPAAPPGHAMGRSITEFGVEPDRDSDQAAPLQKALDAIAADGQPAFLPPGRYRIDRTLMLPQRLSIFGVPRTSIIAGSKTILVEARGAVCHITGIGFASLAGAPNPKPLAMFEACEVSLDACTFTSGGGDLLRLNGCSSMIRQVDFDSAAAACLWAAAAKGVTVSGCRFVQSARGVVLATAQGAPQALAAQNRFEACEAAALTASGSALITANLIRGGAIGLRLGGEARAGHIMAAQNHIAGCAIGIGAEAEGDYVFATLNIISGASGGAIRAFAGGKPVGPDLSQQSAEAFRNLTIAGNVVL